MRAFLVYFNFLMEWTGFWLARFESCGSERKRPLSEAETGLWAAEFALQLSLSESKG
jgi:hypothetical protein